MTELPDINPQIGPEDLKTNFGYIQKSSKNESLYLGNRGFEVLEDSSDTSNYVKIDQEKFNHLINEVINRPSTSREDIKELLKLSSIKIITNQSEQDSQISQVADQTLKTEKRKYTDEQLNDKVRALSFDYSLNEAHPDWQLKMHLQDTYDVFDEMGDELHRLRRKHYGSELISQLINFQNDLDQVKYKFSGTRHDPEFIEFVEEGLELIINETQKDVTRYLNDEYFLRNRDMVFEDRCWQGECTKARINNLLQHKKNGSFLLHGDDYALKTYCSFVKDNKVEKHSLNLCESKTPREAVQQLMGGVITPKPVETKPLSFYQAQLDWHAIDEDPNLDSVEVFPGDCWITRTDKPNHYKIHVYQQSSEDKSYDLVAKEDGIYLSFIDENGREPIQAERLHDLFEHPDFPGNSFLYALFGQPRTVEEIYYRKLMQQISKGSDEVRAVYHKFRATHFAFGDRGNIQIIEIVDKIARRELGHGTYNRYFATRPDRSSVRSEKLAIGIPVSEEPYKMEAFHKGIETIDRIREKCKTLKYSLLPRKVEYYDPDKQKSTYVKMARMAPGGELKKHCGNLSSEGALRAAYDIFAGAKELLDHGIMKMDIKPENFLCLSSDGHNIQPMHSDHDDSLFLDEPITKFLVNSWQYALPNFINTYYYKRIIPKLIDLLHAQIYSLGATLYEMCTGKIPNFGRENARKNPIDYEIGTPLIPEKVFAEDDFFKSVGSGKDSIEQLIWDCIFVDRPDVIKNKITVASAIERIEKLLPKGV